MNSFIENVNYVAGLDNRYGRSVEIFKNNLSLRTESYDVKIKFTYYSNQTKELTSAIVPYSDVEIDDFEAILANFQSQVISLVGGNTFTASSSFTYTNFIINNVATVDIKINSLDDMIKTYGLSITITSGSNELYNINGIVNDTLKILPSLSLITESDIDAIVNVNEIIDDVVSIANSIDNVVTVSNSITNVNNLSNNINDIITVSNNIDNVVTVGGSIDSVNIIAENIDDVTYFADKYLGEKTSNPLVRNDGTALGIADLYYYNNIADSSYNEMKVWSGTSWDTAYAGLQNYYTKSQVHESLPIIGFDKTNTIAPSEGQMAWNIDEGTADLGLYGAVLQIGQEFLVKIRNTSGITINNGSVVMATGSIGNSGRITVAAHDGTIANATSIIGIVTQTMIAGDDGFATILGKVRNINTTGILYGETWIDGDKLYVKPNDGGKLTKIVPTDTETKMSVAYVVHSRSNGTLYVRVLGFDENNFKAWTQARLDLKANIVSPTLSGTPLAPTAATGTNTTQIATTAFVNDEIQNDSSSINTANTLVRRNASGNFAAGTITAALSGNASTATALQTGRTIAMTGDVTWTSGSFNGSANVTAAGTLANTGVTAGTYRSVTTDAKGRITAGTNPTTVSGYGLTDVYTKTQNDTSLALKINNSEKGVANGVSTLDANGKVVLTQIPDSVLGQLEYQGVWNLATMPTATQKGQYWIVSVSGNGYAVGDWAVWNGVAFDKVDNTDAVASVAGRTGNVVLTKSDVGLNLVDNTSDVSKNVLSATKWTTARTMTLTGDTTGSVSIDGSANVSMSVVVVDDSHNHVISNIDNLQTALDAKVDDSDIESVNLLRADKYLAAQNIANMVYTAGDLTKIQYNNATDVNYEVLSYTSGNLTSINHYTTGVLRGTTTLSYSSGNLVSAIFA